MIESALPASSTNAGVIALDELRSATDTTSLSSVESAQHIAFREEIERANQVLKERVANRVMLFLGGSLVMTWLLTMVLAVIDACFLRYDIIQPSERLITETVVMAVIAATVTQVGVASVAIVYSLFGKPKGGDESE